MQAAHVDFETRSTVDLRKSGVHRYAEHPTTNVWCMVYRIGAGGLQAWRPGDEPPYELLEHIENGGRLVAHNAMFERTIWRMLRERGEPWPDLPAEQQDCTMARALAIALPAGLEGAGAAVGAKVTKDTDGRALMMRMCRPRSLNPDGSPVWWTDQEKVDRLTAYCGADVLAECELDARLPQLPPEERELWILDQQINDRGVAIDVALISRAIEVVKAAKVRADERMWRITDGVVDKCTKTAALVAWLDARGVPCTSIAKGEIEDLVEASQLQGDPTAEEAIRLRQAAAKTSTDKFKAMAASVGSDGRCRGAFMFDGASTGRWSGKLWQPHNLPRVDEERDGLDVEHAISLLHSSLRPAEVADAIELCSGRPALEILSKCLRPSVIAAPGKKLVGGDFSNIEGRVNAWLNGERWKLDAFRAYDAKLGPDLYLVSYAASFGVTVEQVDKPKRQIGKVQELALGYQGAVGAYISMGAGYGIKPADIARVARAAVDEATWERAMLKFTRQGSYGLDPDVWTGVRVVVDGWRDAHPRIVQSWWDVQDAAIEAVANPGLIVPVLGGRVRYVVQKGFLWCKLPSGRTLAYCRPRWRWVDSGRKEADGKTPIMKRQVFYEGVDSRTKKWGLQSLYGGKQIENIVQALARDLLVHTLKRCEREGLPIVMHVHDELVAEIEDDRDVLRQFETIMTEPPPWLSDFPLAAKAWEDHRYVK